MRYFHVLIILSLVALGHWYWLIFTSMIETAALCLLTIVLTILPIALGVKWLDSGCLSDKIVKDGKW